MRPCYPIETSRQHSRFALWRIELTLEKDVCVIFNPRAGRDRAKARFERLRDVLGPRAVFQPTLGPGHGEQLAMDAAKSGFPRIAAAGGDGTVHEVANGILRSERSGTILEVYPVGSANDYAHSL